MPRMKIQELPADPHRAVEDIRERLPLFRVSAALPCPDGSILVTVDTRISQYIGRVRPGVSEVTLSRSPV